MIRKEQKNTRRQRRSRSWLFSPVIIAQLVVVMMLAGVGVAFALPAPTSLTSAGSGIYAATATITTAADFTVTDYTLTFNDGLTEVTGVTVVLNNGGSGDHDAAVTVKVLNASVAVRTATVASTTYSAGPHDVPVTFAGLAVASVDSLSILVTEP